MNIIVGSDEKNYLTDYLIEKLRKTDSILPIGALNNQTNSWSMIAEEVATRTQLGEFDFGIVACHTGTGACIAANKIPGVRAALCVDSQSAAGARKWNNANILVLSLRLTTPTTADEILSSWFSNHMDQSEKANIAHINNIEKKYMNTSK